MRGPHIVIMLNGTKTVDTQDTTLKSGPIALQYLAGTLIQERSDKEAVESAGTGSFRSYQLPATSY